MVTEATSNYLSHFAISGLDFLLSLRNPNINTSYPNPLRNWSSAGCGTFNSNNYDGLAYDVLALQHTPLQRFGSRIDPSYTKDLKLQLYRARELGLNSYAVHVGQLTNAANSSFPPSVSDLTQAQRDADVYYQAHLESNPARQYSFALPSVVFAAMVVINDVLITDRTGYWSRDINGYWLGGNYHPDPTRFDVLPTFEFLNCYPGSGSDDDWGYDCNPTSINAAASVLGYHPLMFDYDYDCNLDTNPYYSRSPGALFAHPQLLAYQHPDPTPGQWPDFTMRQYTMWGVTAEFINAIYYQHDGVGTLAVKEAVGPNYLPDQIVDAFTTNIAWTHTTWEGGYYNPLLINSSYPCFKPLSCDQYYAYAWAAPLMPV
jgi:hypothetical protein